MALDLVVVTPEGEAFSEAVEQVVLPGAEGEFGVLESHEKFLAPLQPGPMEIKLPGGRSEWAAISDGFAEVTGSRVVVLVEECFKAHEIDVEQARMTQAEMQRALEEIQQGASEEEHRERFETALARAVVQIDVYSRQHG